ncbi:MAG: hypothetical protein H0X34_08980 [Chthoniobacterales bacterium]|nr:hypothetical protein [Chthoniobacterales bacterium]
MIAVTFALPSESRDFLRLLGNQKRKVTVLHTGVGQKSCRERIVPFLATQPFALLISSGFAGGVDPSLGVGDLLLANNFSNPESLARADGILVARIARLVTAPRIIESEADRRKVARATGAVAVDMETEWVAEACAAKNVPMLSLRAISDTAAAPFPAPPSVLFDLARQRIDARKLSGYLLKNPAAVVRLLRFARQIRLARANLAAALCELLAFA